MKLSSRAFVCLLFSLSFPTAAEVELSVTVSGAKPGIGQVILSVFASSKQYLKEPLVQQNAAIDENGAVVFSVPLVQPGTYAVSAIYDEDNSGDLKTGLFGIPKEAVGFSNNARGRFGPPPFSKTSLEINDDTAIEIKLRRVKK